MSVQDLITVSCRCQAQLQIPTAHRESILPMWLDAHSVCLGSPDTESPTRAPRLGVPEDFFPLGGVIDSIIQQTLPSSPSGQLTIHFSHAELACGSVTGKHQYRNLMLVGSPPGKWQATMGCTECHASLSLELTLAPAVPGTGSTSVRPDSSGSAATRGREEPTPTVVPSTESGSTPPDPNSRWEPPSQGYLPTEDYVTNMQGDDDIGHYLQFGVRVRGLGAMPESPQQVAHELTKFWSGRTSLFGMDRGLLHVEVID